MVQRAVKFGPEVLLSAPRRSAGVPNEAGTLVLYTESTYSFDSHSKSTALKVLDVATGGVEVLARDDDISSMHWLDNDSFACLQSEKDGTTSLWVASVSKVIREPSLGKSHYVAGKIAAAASNLKLAPLDQTGDEFAVVVSAQAKPDGTLYTTSDASKKTQSTGRLYTTLFVRHWDAWKTQEKNSLWYGVLSRKGRVQGQYKLSELYNALKGTGLESPIPPFGGGDHFDVTHNAIILAAKDPDLNPALHTKCNIYLLKLDSWTQAHDARPHQVIVPGFNGAVTSPSFDRLGTKAVFLSMKIDGYEADRNRIFILPNIGHALASNAVSAQEIDVGYERWDRSPSSISFTHDGKHLLFTAEDAGYGALFRISLRGDEVADVPWRLTEDGTVGDFKSLSDNRIFLTQSSLIDSSRYALLLLSDAQVKPVEQTWFSSLSQSGSKFGLNRDQISSIWTPASNPKIKKEVHSWVLRPSDFSHQKTYPVAYVIHGGPQGAWTDSWSTRWNPFVIAEQGYIVVTPNPTGSTGYGQAFTNAIRKNWSGDPYNDIVNVFEWVGKNLPEADNDRAVALGASYGGYMMNWIQGHDLGRKLKAIVCHDGSLTLANMLSTEELYFPFYEFGGVPWAKSGDSDQAKLTEKLYGSSSPDEWAKHDPSRHLDQWATPQLVIHSTKDYRLVIGEGLSAFNVLQTRGVESQLLTYPDENHWVLRPENSMTWHKVVLNWINSHVGLPLYTEQVPENDDFWGGVRKEGETVSDMPAQGKPET